MGRLKSDPGQLFYVLHLSDAVPEDTWMIGKIKIYCARINPRKRREWITSILLAIRSSQVLE